MLKDDSEPRRALTSEELFARALPLLNIAVRQACRRCHHYPTPEDVNRFSQRLVVLLMEDDYCVLDSCKEQAKFPAWLQGLVNY